MQYMKHECTFPKIDQKRRLIELYFLFVFNLKYLKAVIHEVLVQIILFTLAYNDVPNYDMLVPLRCFEGQSMLPITTHLIIMELWNWTHCNICLSSFEKKKIWKPFLKGLFVFCFVLLCFFFFSLPQEGRNGTFQLLREVPGQHGQKVILYIKIPCTHFHKLVSLLYFDPSPKMIHPLVCEDVFKVYCLINSIC